MCSHVAVAVTVAVQGWRVFALHCPIEVAVTDPGPNRKLNTSPSTIDDKEWLKKPLTEPKVKKIDLHFPLGLEVTARNLKGVTIKDALDAIHKQFKKKVSLLSLYDALVLFGLVSSVSPAYAIPLG